MTIDGCGPYQIANMLKEEKILIPSAYLRTDNGKRISQYTCSQYTKVPCGTLCKTQHRINEDQAQMEWVRRMNACKAQAEAIVKFELIYD